MKITILQEKLKEGLDLAGRISPRSASLPVLNNILFKTDKNFLTLSSTDLEMALIWRALAKIEEEGKALLPSQISASLVNFFPNKPITILSKERAAEFECAGHRSSLKTLDPEDFPIIPEVSKNDFTEISIDSFIEGLSQTVNIPSLSSAKPEISGVYFVFQEGCLKIVATDTFRLAEKIISTKKENSSRRSFIIPSRAVKELMNILNGRKGEVKLYFSPNQVLFELLMEETNHPQIQFISRLIDGEFPDYQGIIPQKHETEAVVSQKEILSQIKSAGIFSGRNNEVRLKVVPEKKQIEISSQDPDVGEYQSQIPAKITGKGVEIIFNHKFLTDGLLNMGDEAVFELSGEESPAVIKPGKETGYIYLLMPIKKS